MSLELHLYISVFPPKSNSLLLFENVIENVQQDDVTPF